jgi:hypothetical protein
MRSDRRWIDKTEPGYPSRSVQRNIKRDTPTHVVTNEDRARNSKRIQQADSSLRVPTDRQIATLGEIASTKTEQICDDYPMPGRNERNDVAPQVRRGRESVQQHHRLSAATRSRRVVVEPGSANFDKLPSHAVVPFRVWLIW